MYSKDAEIEENCIKIEAALNQLFESKNSDKKNPYEGMCYVASVVLKNLLEGKLSYGKLKIIMVNFIGGVKLLMEKLLI